MMPLLVNVLSLAEDWIHFLGVSISLLSQNLENGRLKVQIWWFGMESKPKSEIKDVNSPSNPNPTSRAFLTLSNLQAQLEVKLNPSTQARAPRIFVFSRPIIFMSR